MAEPNASPPIASAARFAQPLPADLEPVAPAETARVLALDATALLQEMEQGKLTSAQITSVYIRRARTEGEKLNATTEECFEEALAAAKASDVRRKASGGGAVDGRPLEGLPVSLKDCFDQKGFDSTVGIVARQGRPLAEDGLFVKVLREAGAIPFVRSNVPPLLMGGGETENNVYGRTLNPWDLSRAPGSSSGGEGALIAARGSPLGFGTDIGGSVRIPCAYSGIFGLKPTNGRISTQGLSLQEAPGQIAVLSCPGPMARSTDDLILVCRVLLDARNPLWHAADGDPYMPPTPFDEAQLAAKQPLRIGFFECNGAFAPCATARRAVQQAKARLEEQGHVLVPFTPPEVGEGAKLLGHLLRGDGGAWALDALDGKEQPHRLIAWLVASAQTSDGGQKPPAKLATELLAEVVGLQAHRGRFLAAWRAARLDALLSPGLPIPAPRHQQSAVDARSYTMIYNVLGYPAGIVPETLVRPDEEEGYEGLDPAVQAPQQAALAAETLKGAAGLPVAVQVAALPFRDETVLRVMKALEVEGMKHSVPPTVSLQSWTK